MTEMLEGPGPFSAAEVYELPTPGKKLPPRLSATQIDKLRSGYWTIFTKSFGDEILKETRFEVVATRPVLSDSEIVDITTGGKNCPHCNGTGELFLRTHGRDTKIVVRMSYNCVCKIPLKIHEKWNKPGAVASRFQHVRLGSLAPHAELTLSVDRQQEIIDRFQAKPEDSYLLYGPPGRGKTHCMTALYRAAVEREAAFEATKQQCHTSVFRTTASLLLDQHVAWENRNRDNYDTPEPDVSARAIQEAISDGYRVSLFIDELDKIRASEFKMETLNKLVDLIWAEHGQIVATSNMTMDEMTAKWGGNEAGTLLRRICEGEGCKSVFFGDLPSTAVVETTAPVPVPASVPTPISASIDEDEEDSDVALASPPAKATSQKQQSTSAARSSSNRPKAPARANRKQGVSRKDFNITPTKP